MPSTVKKARAQALAAVVERTGRSVRQGFVGGCRPVLWEWPRGEAVVTGADGQPLRVWNGFTDNYLRVTLEAPMDAALHNTIPPVRLDALHGDTLFGTLVGSGL